MRVFINKKHVIHNVFTWKPEVTMNICIFKRAYVCKMYDSYHLHWLKKSVKYMYDKNFLENSKDIFKLTIKFKYYK